MAAQLTGQPIYILKEGSTSLRGRDAHRTNILAARVIADAIKTTLGPKGMDKMLVDSTGDVVITNDGATILKEVEVKHPAAKMVIEAAKTQEKEQGDGTTTAVVLAGELLKRAEELLDQDVHPTIIVKGYRMAQEKAVETLEKLATKVSADEKDMLLKVAITSLNSKAPGVSAKEHLAELSVEAVKRVAEQVDGKYYVDKEDIKIEKHIGESTRDSRLVEGIVLDKELAHPNMPRRVENAKIALLNLEMKVKKTETDAKLNITSPEQLHLFMEEEEKAVKEIVESVVSAGANVLFCQKDIEDVAQHYLAKNKIFAVKSVSEKDMKRIAKACGASIVTSHKDLRSADLGSAKLVESKKIGDKDFVFVEGCAKPKAVTIFVRGGTEHIVAEVERSLDDSVSVVRDVIEEGLILPGGGAPEMEVAKAIRAYAGKISGREQLAISAFADAMEIIPKTLAENGGLDPIDVLISLRAEHEKGNVSCGIDLASGKAKDMLKLGVVEPLRVKRQAVTSAVEVASMVLRIDDIIAAKGALGKEEEAPKAPPTPPGGGMM